MCMPPLTNMVVPSSCYITFDQRSNETFPVSTFIMYLLISMYFPLAHLQFNKKFQFQFSWWRTPLFRRIYSSYLSKVTNESLLSNLLKTLQNNYSCLLLWSGSSFEWMKAVFHLIPGYGKDSSSFLKYVSPELESTLLPMNIYKTQLDSKIPDFWACFLLESLYSDRVVSTSAGFSTVVC